MESKFKKGDRVFFIKLRNYRREQKVNCKYCGGIGSFTVLAKNEEEIDVQCSMCEGFGDGHEYVNKTTYTIVGGSPIKNVYMDENNRIVYKVGNQSELIKEQELYATKEDAQKKIDKWKGK